VRRTVR